MNIYPPERWLRDIPAPAPAVVAVSGYYAPRFGAGLNHRAALAVSMPRDDRRVRNRGVINREPSRSMPASRR